MGRNLKIKRKKILFSLILVLSLNIVSFPTSHLKIDTANENMEQLNVSNSLVYFDVLINDLPFSPVNWTWAETQPWVDGGSGTLGNPYIIENHFFEFSTGLGDCFALLNSEKYFIIRNCTFRYSQSSSSGIHLINVTNGQFINNRMINNYNGFRFSDCYSNLFDSNVILDSSYVGIWGSGFNEENTFSNNFVNNSNWGIALEDGNNNVITNNIVQNMATNDGILIYGIGNNSIIQNNYINNCYVDGIRVQDSENCIVSNNTIQNCNNYGLYFDSADNNLAFENYFRNNIIHACDTGVNNDWNSSSIGNYWDNYTGYDMNVDGIGDTPYPYIGGGTGSIDYLPIWNIQSPIAIDDLPSSLNNWTWASSQAWCSGSGTELDPYIIENLNIDADLSDFCISISNSEAHFIIQGCSLNNTNSASKGGIFLDNATNGKVTGNSFYKHGNAAVCGSANYLTASDNTVNTQRHGFYLEGSYNEILSNTIYGDKSGTGIVILYGGNNHDNLIDDNIVENCYQGIHISSSENSTITDNTALNNDHYGILLLANTNNNYLSGNLLLNNGWSGMIIENSIDNIIEETLADGNHQHGMTLTNANDTTIHDNIFKNNVMDGVHIDSASSNNLLYGNVFLNNSRNAYDDGVNNHWNSTTIGNYWDNYTGYDMNFDGIGDISYNYIGGSAGSIDYLPICNIQGPIIIDDNPGSSNNWTWASSQAWCSGSGTELDPYIIENLNIDARWTDFCISISNSEAHFVIQDCTLNNTGYSAYTGGIILDNVTNGKINGNIFYNHGFASIYAKANFITISSNTLTNQSHGIYIEGSYNEVLSNTIYGSGSGSGVIIQFDISYHDNLIDGNTIENCWQGIFIFASDNNTITENTVLNNLQYGIVLTSAANNNYLSGNLLLNNTLSGMIIDTSMDNIIEETLAEGNQNHGIYLTNADDTTIHDNILKNNVMDGINIATGSANNLIYRNFFLNNGRHAYDNGANNDWNSTTMGNYWDNHTGPDTAPHDGIVDVPYTYIGGGAGSIDYLPIAKTTPPLITINLPINDAPYDVAPDFDISIADQFLYEMWYTLDNGLHNHTFTEFTGIVNQSEWDLLTDGTYTLTFYASDKAGYIGVSSVNIQKDTIAPTINIVAPTTDDTFSSRPNFIVEIFDANLDSMWYSFDGGVTNYMFTSNGTINSNAWAALSVGSVTITFYANDTLGHLTFQELTFAKSAPEGLDPVLMIIIIASVGGGVAVLIGVLIFIRKRRKSELEPLTQNN
jgi:parallel beta-helix repeat protein